MWGSPQTPTSRTRPLSYCGPSCPRRDIAWAPSGSRIWRVRGPRHHLTPWSRAGDQGSAEPWGGWPRPRESLDHEGGRMIPQRGALGKQDVSVPTHHGGLSPPPWKDGTSCPPAPGWAPVEVPPRRGGASPQVEPTAAAALLSGEQRQEVAVRPVTELCPQPAPAVSCPGLRDPGEQGGWLHPLLSGCSHV